MPQGEQKALDLRYRITDKRKARCAAAKGYVNFAA